MSWHTVGDLVGALIGDEGFFSSDSVLMLDHQLIISRKGQMVGLIDLVSGTVEKYVFDTEKLICDRDLPIRQGVEL